MQQWKNKKRYTKKQALVLGSRYCVSRERSHYEMRSKLRNYGLSEEEAEEVLAELISMNFVSEERFAESYVRGKFNQLAWGKNKLREGLRAHQVTEKMITQALKQLNEEDYLNKLTHLLKRKQYTLNEQGLTTWELRVKLSNYALSKGFEGEEIKKVLEEVLEEILKEK